MEMDFHEAYDRLVEAWVTYRSLKNEMNRRRVLLSPGTPARQVTAMQLIKERNNLVPLAYECERIIISICNAAGSEGLMSLRPPKPLKWPMTDSDIGMFIHRADLFSSYLPEVLSRMSSDHP